MNKKVLLLILVLTSLSLVTQAQVNRYMIFFTDKEGSPYSLEQPEAFLSDRSLARRDRFNIPVTEKDLPLSVNYVNGVQEAGATVFFHTRWLNGVLVEMGETLVNEINQLEFVREVLLVAPGSRLEPVSGQMDQNYKPGAFRKESISNALQNNMLGVDQMHEDGYTGKKILIGVFDAGFTGVDISPYFEHLFENNRILATRDFTRNSSSVFQFDDHGTGVLSAITAYLENDYEGIAYDAEVILGVTEDTYPEYLVEEYNWLFAAEWADSLGVDIINTSLGYNRFDDPSMNYTYEDMDGNTAIITRATDMAAARGILCVVSVGNEGNNSWRKLVAPADADSVLSVGAVDAGINHVSFSSSGPTADGRIKPEVVALGQSTKIVQYDGSIASGSGTSFASPLVAGLAAGLWEAYPELNNMELINLITRGSSKYPEPDTLLGYGLPDYIRIRSFITSLQEEQQPEDFMRIYPNPVDHHKLFVELNHLEAGNRIEIQIFDLDGRRLFYSEDRAVESMKKMELDLFGLPPGLYVLNVNAGRSNGSAKILIP